MTRIFPILAALDALLLSISFALGVVSKLRDGVHNPSDQTFWYHFLAGLSAEVLTLLVHCLIFTYFLGTGRWVKEVKIAYTLPDEPLPKLTRDLKRRVFPPALFAMLTATFTGAAGAAALGGAGFGASPAGFAGGVEASPPLGGGASDPPGFCSSAMSDP